MSDTSEDVYPPRRRRRDQVVRERTSLSLRSDVLDDAREIVESGQAENLSAFVEAALQEKVRRTKRDALYAAYEAAAQDPEYQKSMSALADDFAAADTDGLRPSR